jgi:hypothetical protein
MNNFYLKHQDEIELIKGQLGIIFLTFLMMGGF